MFVGCQGNGEGNSSDSSDRIGESQNSQSEINTQQSEKEDNVDVETGEEETVEMDLFDTTQKFPKCIVKEIGSQDFLKEGEQLDPLRLQGIVGDKICVVARVVTIEMEAAYRLLTCDLNGDNVQVVELTLPEKGTFVDTVRFGRDGYIYGLIAEGINNLFGCYKEGESFIVAWDLEGKIISEIRPELSNGETDQQMSAYLLGVSEDGTLNCRLNYSDRSQAIIAHISPDGGDVEINQIVMGEDYSMYWIYNQDGNCSWVVSERLDTMKPDRSYLAYDMESREFTKRVELPIEITNWLEVCGQGISKDEIFVSFCSYTNCYVFKYYPYENKVEPVAEMEKADNHLKYDILEISEGVYFLFEKMQDNKSLGMYLYTQVENE